MKSNYKPIGDLVERVDNRNKDGAISNLLGLSIDKKFIPSVANTIGTDLSTYKIIQKNDFAVSLMQVSRDSKIPVACQKEYEAAIMSPAYSIFRVKDADEILPDYLEMWFKRSEFDREAAFIAVGGVRGSMPWEEFAGIKVYVPKIEQQRKLVRQYRTIADRIALKQRINDNLATQGLVFLKQLKERSEAKGIPWQVMSVKDLVAKNYIDTPIDGNHGELHPKVDDYISEGIPFIMANNLENGYVNYETCAFISEKQANSLRKGFSKKGDVLLTHKGTLGRTAIVSGEYDVTILTPQVTYYRVKHFISSAYLKYYFDTQDFQKVLESWAGSGSTRAYIGIVKQLELPICIPDESSMSLLNKVLCSIENIRRVNYLEFQQLNHIQKLLLSLISSR